MNKYIRNIIPLLLLVIIFQSCANYKLNYANDYKEWEKEVPTTDLKIKHSVYLIGDTGNAYKGLDIPLFAPLKEELDKASENSSIIFLGDNIYPVGMPPKSEKAWRSVAEYKLDVQLDMLEDYDGNIMFIPGNHDWARYGLKGVNRQQKYIEKNLNRKRNGTDDDDDDEWQDYFFPGDGCGDPEVVEVNDQLAIVLIDSEWWLRNWNLDQSINDGCDIKTRAAFFRDFEENVRKLRNRNVIIAMHHPLHSSGQHGGNYTLENHIFPLRFLNKGLYVPLPVLGSVIAFIRGTVGVPQDLANAKYRDMRNDIIAAVGKNGSYIIAAGHEHTLQYSEEDNQQFIVSGSGSKENAASIRGGTEFSYGRLGYSRIDFYEDGSAWTHFYALNDDQKTLDEVYRKKIKGELEISKDNIPSSFPEFEKKETVIVRKPNNFEFSKVGLMHKAILGTHYSDLYLKDYPFDVLDLADYEGGVYPVKRGGGNQTNSLRLESPSGHQFVMRALTKDASRTLPYPLNQMIGAKNILQDNFMAAHPFAALMVPDLADAANVYHTNPHLYYVPKQPILDYHNDLFGGDIYLLEERPDGDWSNEKSFGNSEKIMSTKDVIEKIIKSRKHRVDQQWLVRSRILDYMIKDWDRHEDQWRWARFDDDDGDGYMYRPIPRDRDQAFSKYDGFLNWVVWAVNPFMRQLQKYTPDTKNMKWQGWNATFFDQTFLGELEWEDWEKEAKYIQENVTDEVIELAFSRIPDKAKDDEWKEILEFTKERRENLVDIARRAYVLKSKVVDILGTDKEDRFEIDRISDTQTRVKVFRLNKDGDKKGVVFERVFDHDITKEIHMYGMEDDDLFIISGDVDKSLTLRIIGGEGDDEIIEESTVKSGSKKTLIYDSSEEKNKLKLGTEGKDFTSRKVKLNTYDRRSFHYNPDYWLQLPVLSYNLDDGFIAGVDLSFVHNSFKKDPFGQRHNFTFDYSFGTQAINFNYIGEYLESVSEWDLLTQVTLRRNRFAFNYFGFGNETVNVDPDDLDFNRVRQSKVYAGLHLRKRFSNDDGSFTFGPTIERTRIQNTPGKFIGDLGGNDLPSNIYEDRNYAGFLARFSYESLDQNVDPHRGMKFHLSYNVETNIENTDFTFGDLSTAFTIYQNLDKKENLILASQVAYQSIRGDYDFFQAPTIGGINNLRGFREERFRGDAAFYHMTDIRLKLFRSVNNVVPFTLGIHAGFDYGRVWEEGKNSNTYHSSYGGGIYLNPVDFIVMSFGQYFSKEDSRFIFKLSQML